MEILFLMVPLGLVLVGFGVWAFFWAVGNGQFDDLDSPGWSVLGDEDPSKPRDAGPAPTDDDNDDRQATRP
ncbi:MAG: cbb3-type cytochrome oxidase assembly protein CcoS [Steroidobacteraceae bacterium]